MSQWSWHVFDLATGAALGQVPLASWSHTDRLNDSGEWAATMSSPESVALVRYALNCVVASKAVLVAVRVDNVGAARAEYTGWIPPGGNRRPDLAGKNLLGYLDFRVIESTVAYSSIDQHSIAAGIVSTAVGTMIDTSQVTASGVTRVRTWNNWEAKNVGEALRQLSAVENGFDFDVRTEYDTGTLRRRLRCWYPRRGAVLSPSQPLVFEYGRNMLTLPTIDGNADFATRVVAIGKEQDSATQARLVSIQTNSALIAAGYPVIVKHLDRSDITTQGGLDDLANGELDRASTLQDDEISFQVDPNDPSHPWGSWDLGASCYVKVPPGVALWWPDGIQEERRVVAHKWTWNAGTGETLEVVTSRRWEGLVV